MKMSRKPEFYGRDLVEGEVRTIFTVVVSDTRTWSADDLDGALWDGCHGPDATKIDFHVKYDAAWGPITITKRK